MDYEQGLNFEILALVLPAVSFWYQSWQFCLGHVNHIGIVYTYW